MEEEELSEQKKAELRRIADTTYEAIVATAEKISKLESEQQAARASE